MYFKNFYMHFQIGTPLFHKAFKHIIISKLKHILIRRQKHF